MKKIFILKKENLTWKVQEECSLDFLERNISKKNIEGIAVNDKSFIKDLHEIINKSKSKIHIFYLYSGVFGEPMFINEDEMLLLK